MEFYARRFLRYPGLIDAMASNVPGGVKFENLVGELIGVGQGFVDDPVLAGLRRAKDQSQLNPALVAATHRAHQRAVAVLFRTREKFSYASLPHVVVPGDGGVVIEWRAGDDVVSVDIDAHNRELDVIYVRSNDASSCHDFSYDVLEDFLTALLAGDQIADHLAASPAFGTVDRPVPWTDLAGSGTIAYCP